MTAMEGAFSDALSDLVGRAISRAVRDDDDERAAEVVAALVDQLGKAIAITCKGHPVSINTMLTGVEGALAEIATDMGDFVAAVKLMKDGG